jgi:hypothetical protein
MAHKTRKKRHRRQPLPKETVDRYKCNDCAVNVLKIGEFYMFRDWEKLGLGWEDNLCIGCLEKRLRRKVGPMLKDFCSLPNYKWMYPNSERMLDRYGFVKDTKGKWRYNPQQTHGTAKGKRPLKADEPREVA